MARENTQLLYLIKNVLGKKSKANFIEKDNCGSTQFGKLPIAKHCKSFVFFFSHELALFSTVNLDVSYVSPRDIG